MLAMNPATVQSSSAVERYGSLFLFDLDGIARLLTPAEFGIYALSTRLRRSPPHPSRNSAEHSDPKTGYLSKNSDRLIITFCLSAVFAIALRARDVAVVFSEEGSGWNCGLDAEFSVSHF
jgi:hypothetical protein